MIAVGRSLLHRTIWLWLKNPVPTWNPGKWKHGPNLRNTPLFNFEPHLDFCFTLSQGSTPTSFDQSPFQVAPHAASTTASSTAFAS